MSKGRNLVIGLLGIGLGLILATISVIIDESLWPILAVNLTLALVYAIVLAVEELGESLLKRMEKSSNLENTDGLKNFYSNRYESFEETNTRSLKEADLSRNLERIDELTEAQLQSLFWTLHEEIDNRASP